METKEINKKRVNQGRNIRDSRYLKGLKQETVADKAQISQSTLSKAENSRFVDDDILQKIAKALDVPYEYLRDTEEEASTVIFENNTITNHDSTVNGCASNIGSYTNIFDPVEKMVELYERMLKEKDEKYATLENRIRELEGNK